jgi:hypothetical protein
MKNIVIKSFSALSYELVVQWSETRGLGLPRLSHPRLRFTPDSVQGWNIQPYSLAVTEPMEARPAFEKALNAWRGEGTENPRAQCLSHGC